MHRRESVSHTGCHKELAGDVCLQQTHGVADAAVPECVVLRSQDEVRATISTGISVNHLITVFIALFGGWVWQTLGIETLFILSAVLGLCNSAYAATIKTNKGKH